MYRRANRLRFSKVFSPIWVALWHPSDEAICGLKAVKEIRLTIFSRYFAAPAFAFSSIFVIPVAIAVLGIWPNVAIWLYNDANFYLGSARTVAGPAPGGFVQNVVMVGAMMLAPILYSADMTKQSNAIFAVVLMLTALPAALFAISLTVTFVVGAAASGISFVASKVLNNMTNRQIRISALGSDMRGEFAQTAMEYPAWVDSGFAPLPTILCDEISEFSDREAAKSLVKFRRAIGHLTFSESETESANFIQSYLGWDELIHTCYFNVPRFRKLVAYSISTGEGFCATEQFKGDPDYAIVREWYEEIQPGKNTEPIGPLSAGSASPESLGPTEALSPGQMATA
jgi:hypothetical protein